MHLKNRKGITTASVVFGLVVRFGLNHTDSDLSRFVFCVESF